jgi:hypothetical protein
MKIQAKGSSFQGNNEVTTLDQHGMGGLTFTMVLSFSSNPFLEDNEPTISLG